MSGEEAEEQLQHLASAEVEKRCKPPSLGQGDAAVSVGAGGQVGMGQLASLQLGRQHSRHRLGLPGFAKVEEGTSCPALSMAAVTLFLF